MKKMTLKQSALETGRGDEIRPLRLRYGRRLLWPVLVFGGLLLLSGCATSFNTFSYKDHTYQGAEHLKWKEYRKAEKEFKEALRLKPNEAEAHLNLGLALNGLVRYEEAEKEFREALRINPDCAEAHSGLGRMFLVKSKVKDAESEFRLAIQLDPKNAAAHNRLGVALEAKGDHAEAEKEFRTALRLNPDFNEALMNMAGLLGRRGAKEEAALFKAKAEKAKKKAIMRPLTHIL